MKYEKGGFFEINVDASLFFIEPCELNAPLRFRHRFNLKKKKGKKSFVIILLSLHVKEKKRKGKGISFERKKQNLRVKTFFFFSVRDTFVARSLISTGKLGIINWKDGGNIGYVGKFYWSRIVMRKCENIGCTLFA